MSFIDCRQISEILQDHLVGAHINQSSNCTIQRSIISFIHLQTITTQNYVSKIIPLNQSNQSTTKSTHNPQTKIQLQPPVSNPRPKIQPKLLKHLTPIITPQHYTSMRIKHLGNHSRWKRTPFQTRYNDERLNLMKPDYFLNRYVLDIGCNEGFLDVEIAMRYFPKQVYAIDIDYRLVKNARKTLYSIVKRDKSYQDLFVNEKGQFEKSAEEETSEKDSKKQAICTQIQELPLFFQDRIKSLFVLDHYLPESVQIYTPPSTKIQSKFPFNIKFQCDNIYTIKYQEDKLQYDTILCLKVTKWIHLTFGDDGIRRLFQKIYDLLRLDGILILQAQDWPSYKKKKNMFDIYRKNYDQIQLGPDQFETVLVDDPLKEFKFQLVEKIERDYTKIKKLQKLNYPILILKKKSTMLYY